MLPLGIIGYHANIVLPLGLAKPLQAGQAYEESAFCTTGRQRHAFMPGAATMLCCMTTYHAVAPHFAILNYRPQAWYAALGLDRVWSCQHFHMQSNNMMHVHATQQSNM